MENDNTQTNNVDNASPEAAVPMPDKVETVSSEGGFLDAEKMGILQDVAITMTIEIGRAKVKIKDLLELTKGSVIELDKLAGDPVDIYVNGKLVSKGHIITANGKYCVRLLSMQNGQSKGET